MSDLTYKKFIERWEDVLDLPPQTLGPFTLLYKAFVRRFKVMPWQYFVSMAMGLVLILYFLVGSTITLLVTILQRGF